jgi:dTDP-4-amino-4,6-dideoxygalactose transaminase
MSEDISYVDLAAQWSSERDELLPLIEKVLASGQYVGSDEVSRFEKDAASYFGVTYACALNSGTDALMYGLAALGVKPGDEVITPPNSFIASTAAIVHLGAIPVFVDVQPDQNIDPSLIRQAITQKTKAIMPVHLTGRVANMLAICEVANEYCLAIIEDAAQAAGSSLENTKAGAWGSIGCFSAHPLKNLNAFGDAGFVLTQDKEIFDKITRMRNHGLTSRDTVEEFGYVSRLDSIQAAVLRNRLTRLDDIIFQRKENAKLYKRMLSRQYVFIPPDGPSEDNAWHTFVIQVDNRDSLRDYLRGEGIETAVHYPIPIHLQPAAKYLGYSRGSFPEAERQAGRILTLPIHHHLKVSQVERVALAINRFFEG